MNPKLPNVPEGQVLVTPKAYTPDEPEVTWCPNTGFVAQPEVLNYKVSLGTLQRHLFLLALPTKKTRTCLPIII